MILSVCGATVTLLGAYGLGATITRQRAGGAASLAAGAAAFSLLLFACLTVSFAPNYFLWLPLALLGILRAKIPALPAIPRRAWFVLVPFGVYALVHALSPETQPDANVYHLQTAIDALRSGTFSRIVGFYERLPQALELLYIPAFAIGGASAARLVHLALLFATLPVIAALGGHFGLSRATSWTAAALYAVSPVVLGTSASAYNDAALTFASTTAIYVLATGGPVWIAGLIAGFCFGIKMTGGIVAALGLAWLLLQRRWRDAAVFSFAALIPAAPWIIRNRLQAYNPLAPFANRLFPNPLFHISTEQTLLASLRNYGIGFWQRFPEVIWGWRLQGMIGPAFALAPLALLTLRRNRRKAAPLLLMAAVLSIPWWLNAGARFLMPAVPFLALAMLAAIPARLAPAILAVQAILCWPQVLDRLQPHTPHLFGFPIKAALGLDPDFLARTNWDYRYAKLVEENTDQTSVILDLYGLHRAHLASPRIVVGYWQSAWPENVVTTLEFARQPGEEKLFEVRASLRPQPVGGIRIRPAEPNAGPWSVVEVELRAGRNPLPVSARWLLSARPNPWETPLAFDGNLATRWQTWQPTEPRQWLAASFPEPARIDTVRVISTHWDAGNRRFELDIQEPGGRWTAVPAAVEELAPLNLQRAALKYAARSGFTHIVGRSGDTGMDLLVQSLTHAEGVRVAAGINDFYVLDIR